MINLLPPDGKRRVVVDYWLRTVSVYFILIGIGFLVVSALLLPTYFYISFQSGALDVSVGEVSGEVQSYKELEDDIELANDISELLTKTPRYIDVGEVISEIQSFSGVGIEIQSVSFEKDERKITSVVVSGSAADRSTLVEFRNAAEANRLFSEVNLPLSNLAQDQNIPFSLILEPSETLQAEI